MDTLATALKVKDFGTNTGSIPSVNEGPRYIN